MWEWERVEKKEKKRQRKGNKDTGRKDRVDLNNSFIENNII